MTEQLSAIDRYRAQWKPDQAKIAEYKALYEKAVSEGNWQHVILYFDALSRELRPPRHLPIKRLETTDDSS